MRYVRTMQLNNNNLIIPIFIPNIGCPYRCIFCDQSAITGARRTIPSLKDIEERINQFLSYTKTVADNVQLSFYGGNFLGIEKEHIKSLLDSALDFVEKGKINSIGFSTRPDTINKETLDILKDYPVSTIEIGAQSMNDDILKKSLRGHTASDTVQAVKALKDRGYKTGVQGMIGLPGDDEIKAVQSFREIAESKPDFVRIYPTVVLKNSGLAKLYKAGDYKPFSLNKAVSIVKKIYLFLNRKKIPIIRIGLQADDSLTDKSAVLSGPFHPAFGHLVYSEIFFDKAVSIIKQQNIKEKRQISFKVNPRDISKMRGLKNDNIKTLQHMFGFDLIRIIAEKSVEIGNIQLG